MAEPVDLILPMLREMRAENAALHERTRTMIAALDIRLGTVEKRQDSFRSALTADSLLSKLVTGDFERRMESIERRLHDLEHQK
jgi:hypothetical protein